MRNIFRKAITVLGSAALIGATVGAAAAASYPSPFTSNTAVVVSGNANAAPLDLTGASAIAADLSSVAAGSTGGSTTVSGGDSVLLERTSDKLNLGNSASTVFVTSLDAEDMPNLLADGTYTDDDNTEYDYTQKITLGSNLVLEHFADSDYKDKMPTVGIKLSDDEHVLNYTLEFTTNPHFNDTYLETTNMVLMGKTYYVLDVVNSTTANSRKVTLLDSANSAVITEGETLTVGGKSVSIEFISSSEAKLSIDGESTNSLAEGGTYKLDDGSYIGIKDILYSSKDTGVSKVEISIGSGKLEITNGAQVELNDETVQEVVGFIDVDSSLDLDKVTLQWTVDDESFIASGSELELPGFESVKLSISNFIVEAEEETSVSYDGSDVIELSTTLKDGEVTIPILKANSTGEFQSLGKDTSNRLKTAPTTWLFFNETAGDKYFIASWNSTTEAESYYLRMEMVTEDNVNKVRITNEITDSAKTVTTASDVTFGSVTLTVNNVTRDGSKKWANISINSGGSFNTLYTKEGMKVYLPFYSTSLSALGEGAINVTANGTTGAQFPVADIWAGYGIYNATVLPTAGYGYDSIYMFFAEEDKDSNLAAGRKFNVTLDDTSDKVTISSVNVGDSSGTYGFEVEDSDDYEAYANSDLATKTMYSTGGDQDSVVISYHGDQAYSELRISAPEATISQDGDSGVKVYKDNESASFAGMNLVVVGGSAINSIAAELLGGAYSEGAFTTATGVSAGQFLIQSFNKGGKTALLVAGYNAADTDLAVRYLTNEANTVDTTVGKKYVGSSATEASLVVA
jgi:hypothetical protein